jgi:hypothetical protein
MRRRSLWLPALLAAVFMAASAPGYGQLEEALGGLSDENLEGYLEPLNTGLSTTMNSAMFRTGYIPKEGFTITVGASAMAIGYDDEDRVYIPTDPEGFTSLEPTEVPTVVGDPGAKIVEGENNLAQIFPGGFDMETFEIAVPEATVGAFYGTQVKVRYIALDLADSDIGDFSYFGIGGQHSLTQYAGEDPPVDIAIGLFWQTFSIGDNDEVEASSFHADVTASKSFGVIQPYAALGLDQLKLDVKVEDDDDPDNSVDVSLESKSDPHLTLGVAAQLSVVRGFFEFNAAAASGFALGIAFGI